MFFEKAHVLLSFIYKEERIPPVLISEKTPPLLHLFAQAGKAPQELAHLPRRGGREARFHFFYLTENI